MCQYLSLDRDVRAFLKQIRVCLRETMKKQRHL